MPTTPSEKPCVLIVDDSPLELELFADFLSNAYQIKTAESGEKALLLAAESPRPDVILLDLNLEDTDGFEICERLKRDPATQDSAILFVSSTDTTMDKLKGYGLGAHDFLVKPIDLEVLHKKVELAIQIRRTTAYLLADKQRATQTAMMAISSAGELNVVLDFMRQSFMLLHPEAIAKLLVDSVQRYSLESTLQVRATQTTFHVSSNGTTSPLEVDMLNRMKDRGRMVERNHSLIINFPSCSLLVKSMPQDENLLGRLRDSLCLLMESADARIKAMDLELRNNHLLCTIIDMVNKSRQQLTAIHQLTVDRRVLHDVSNSLIEKRKIRLISSLQQQSIPDAQIAETTQGLEESLKFLQQNFDLSLAADHEIMKLVDQLNENLQNMIMV